MYDLYVFRACVRDQSTEYKLKHEQLAPKRTYIIVPLRCDFTSFARASIRV